MTASHRERLGAGLSTVAGVGSSLSSNLLRDSMRSMGFMNLRSANLWIFRWGAELSWSGHHDSFRIVQKRIWVDVHHLWAFVRHEATSVQLTGANHPTSLRGRSKDATRGSWPYH